MNIETVYTSMIKKAAKLPRHFYRPIAKMTFSQKMDELAKLLHHPTRAQLSLGSKMWQAFINNTPLDDGALRLTPKELKLKKLFDSRIQALRDNLPAWASEGTREPARLKKNFNKVTPYRYFSPYRKTL